MATIPGVIARPAELRRVHEFATATQARPAGLALVGEAGAGKSTLWRAGVDAAVKAGHRVLRCEPSAGEADLSFAGLTDLLSDVLPLAAEIPDPQREALEVALLLRPAGAEPPTARAIGLGVLAALRARLSHGPVLVAIDDAHWLDEATRDALTFALRRVAAGPLSLLLAARTEAAADPLTVAAPPVSLSWTELLAAMPEAQRVDLAPLNSRQIRRLLSPTMSAVQAREVAEKSRGNPFWAKEVAASLQTADAAVPPLAATLAQRLSRSLSPAADAALTVVAAAGRIEVADATAVLDDLDDPAAALDAAVLAGVVVETGGRVTAAHPLIGAAAVDSLPPGRRSRVYRRLAAVSRNPERYAHFAALAAGPGPDAAVAEALYSAAAAAHSRAANAAAGQHAVQAVLFTPEAEHAARVRRRIRAAELLFLAGDVRSSLGQLETLDLDRLSTADMERALPLFLDMTELVRGSAAATAIVTGAVESCGSTDPRRRGLVLALASDVAYGAPGSRRKAATEAIACAESAGPAAAATLHRALINLAMANVIAAEGLDRELLDRAAALEETLPVLRLHDTADLHLGLWSRYTEDLQTARAALGRSVARAREAGDDFALATFLSYLAATEQLAGDYAAAATAIEAGDTAAAWHDWPVSPFHLEPRCAQLIAAGELDAALAAADEHLPDTDSSPAAARAVGAWVRATVSAWRGDAAAALSHFERAALFADQLGWRDPGVRLRIDPAMAQAYTAVGRLDDATRISAWLRQTGERLRRPALIGDACRIAALVAAEAGEIDIAAESAHAAVAAHGAGPLRVELARSLLVLGQIERRRKARKQARSALSRAEELASDIGHRPLLADIRQELPRVAAVRSGSGLTATEQRVADLITSGATSRDAAAELFVSVRTVETHVASIYRKLGVRTRAELMRKLSGASRGGPPP